MNLWNCFTRNSMSHRVVGLFAALAAALTMTSTPLPLAAQTIIEEWDSVRAPAPPELKPVTVDTKATALLLLDFAKQNCGKRPRCIASLPKVQKMAAEARVKNTFVVHSLVGTMTKEDLLIAALDNEPIVTSSVDKFFRTDLEKILKDKGITTVIVTGTSAHGAVLNTAAAATLRGFKVILPVDAMSSDPYSEQYTAWHLANGPGVIGPNVTVTRIDMLKW